MIILTSYSKLEKIMPQLSSSFLRNIRAENLPDVHGSGSTHCCIELQDKIHIHIFLMKIIAKKKKKNINRNSLFLKKKKKHKPKLNLKCMYAFHFVYNELQCLTPSSTPFHSPSDATGHTTVSK